MASFKCLPAFIWEKLKKLYTTRRYKTSLSDDTLDKIFTKYHPSVKFNYLNLVSLIRNTVWHLRHKYYDTEV